MLSWQFLMILIGISAVVIGLLWWAYVSIWLPWRKQLITIQFCRTPELAVFHLFGQVCFVTVSVEHCEEPEQFLSLVRAQVSSEHNLKDSDPMVVEVITLVRQSLQECENFSAFCSKYCGLTINLQGRQSTINSRDDNFTIME